MVTITINAFFWLKVVSVLASVGITAYIMYERGFNKGLESLEEALGEMMLVRDGRVNLAPRGEQLSTAGSSESESVLKEKITELESENLFLRTMVEQLKDELNSEN